MKAKYSAIILTLCSLAASCTHEAPEIELSVMADRTSVSVGEPVTLSITHDAAAGLVAFNGEEGHKYELSALHCLAGKSEEEIRNTVFRVADPLVKPTVFDFSGFTGSETFDENSTVTLVNAGSGDCIIPSEGQLVDTDSGKALKITSTHPEWWYQAIRLNLNSRPGANTLLKLTMRFEKDYLSKIGSGDPAPEVPTFMVVIRLAGRAAGSDDVVFSDETVWDVYWAPSTTSTDYSIDLSRIIAAWEAGTGLKMDFLDYAQILMTTSEGAYGYIGDFWIEKVQFGDYDYMPFDTAEAVGAGSAPGTVTYTHAFSAPGDYVMTVVATSSSLKNYVNGGYKDDPASKISASEFNVRRELRTVNIHVE